MFNPHGNVTADGVLIKEGLRVFTNNLDVGTVTEDRDARVLSCCTSDVHDKAQFRPAGMGGWFSDHKAGTAAVDAGCYCRHDHWFNVTLDKGGVTMMNGERMTAVFEGREA